MSMITILSKYALILSLLVGQTGMGLYVNAMRLMGNVESASSSPSILVGPGFTDVSPHEIVRTSANVLYTVAPTCDSYPTCPANMLRIFRANQSGTPMDFTEQDAAHRPAGVGSAAIAIDGTDGIHAIWNDRGGNINYRMFSTTSNLWGSTTIIAATNWTDFGQGDEGVALALDSSGVPHAVWSAVGADGKLHVWYANKASGWSVQQVDDVALTGNRRALHPTAAFTAANDLLVAWLEGTFNYTPDGLIRVRTRLSAGTWSATVTIPDTAMTTIDNGPSLLVTPDGTEHIVFLNPGTATDGSSTTGDYIHYFYNSGGGWVANHPGGGTQITHDPSLGPGPNGTVRIYGHGWQGGSIDGHGNDLYLFEGPGGGGAWRAWTLYASGSFDSSVSTRWAQFFQAFSLTFDIAYWADAYPNMLYVGTEVSSSATPAVFPQPRLTTVIPEVQVLAPVRRSPTVTIQATPQPLPLHR